MHNNISPLPQNVQSAKQRKHHLLVVLWNKGMVEKNRWIEEKKYVQYYSARMCLFEGQARIG
jgi:hypothetical protein